MNAALERLYDEWLAKTGDAAAAATLTLAQIQASSKLGEANEAPLKPSDVAKLLHVSPHTVLGWINTGQMKAANIATGSRPRYLIQRSDLDRFLSCRQPDPPFRGGRRAA